MATSLINGWLVHYRLLILAEFELWMENLAQFDILYFKNREWERKRRRWKEKARNKKKANEGERDKKRENILTKSTR